MTTGANRVWWDEAGHADHPLIALVHGAMDRSAGLLKLSRVLDKRFRVLRYDRRGYGRSAPHDGPFTMEDQLDDLFMLLAERPAIVVGHSYGGNVALAAAQRRPEQVRGVALYETPLSWRPWWPSTTAGSKAVESRDAPAIAAETFMRRMVGDEKWESLPEGARETRRREGVTMIGELADLRDHEPWQAERIGVPVFAAYGSLGAEHHRRGMAAAAGEIPGAVLEMLEGCRHDAPMTDAELFVARLVDPLVAAVGAPWSDQRLATG